MKFTKTTYNTCNFDNKGNVEAVSVEGYSFQVRVGESIVTVCTHRNEHGNWELTDCNTGLLLTKIKYGTRREAAEKMEGASDKLAEYLSKHPHKYRAQSEVFAEMVASGKPMKAKQMNEEVEKRAMGLARQAQTEPVEEPSEVATDVSLEVMLETMREELKDFDDVTVWQKSPKSQVRVDGNTKPHVDTLKAHGFKWSRRKKFWWYKPQVA